MPMILALNGAEFGELGASYSSGIANLQAALVALGKGIGDPTLMKVAVDGIMGPKTAAATNRALTVHLGSGQAPSNLRSGSLPQATITSMASQITALLEAEISRRGFAAPSAVKAPVKKAAVARPAAAAFVPTAMPSQLAPAAASPVYRVPSAATSADSTDLSSVMKWAAIGVGVVALGGVAYYFATRNKSGGGGGLRARTGVPGGALRGFGTTDPIDNHERELWVKNDQGLWEWYQSESRRMKGGMRAFLKRNRAEIDAAIRGVRDREPPKTRLYGGFGNVVRGDEDTLEAIIDRAPNIRDVFESISSIADGKAEHLETNWQDKGAAREWSRFARAVERFGAKVRVPGETRMRRG